MAVTTLGADAVFLLGAANLSDYIDTVTFTIEVNNLDVTTFGNNGHRKRGGLTDGSIAIGGVYDTSTNGPHDVFAPLMSAVPQVLSTFTWRPEGTGAGLASYTGNVLIENYVESSPVADVVRWTATLSIDGDVVKTNQ